MSRMNRGKGILLLAAAAFFTGCSDAFVAGPETELRTHAGTVEFVVQLRLSTPHDDDGALLVQLGGVEILHAEPARSEYQVLVGTPDSTTGMVRIALVSDHLQPGPLAVLRVRGAASDVPGMRLLEAADRDNRLRADLDAYGISAEVIRTHDDAEGGADRRTTRP